MDNTRLAHWIRNRSSPHQPAQSEGLKKKLAQYHVQPSGETVDIWAGLSDRPRGEPCLAIQHKGKFSLVSSNLKIFFKNRFVEV